MSDCCDLKCEREFSKINDSHFQHLGLVKIAKSSSNFAIYFQMRFPILVHCEQVPGTHPEISLGAKVLIGYQKYQNIDIRFDFFVKI